ncbi:uncharacterized protein VICG_00207 [Vittaforma corneae ATCC 50505]|uniref:Uncharacterized protein n=1 Tax=Vittaforma corneae (strain ATCC 50505) TaxID=993615 RepID=L2GRD6_VITCO|nr:uncharacterized protein VICG_00207 [Vittaforma corneae ATCC 50505]ELA42892.1 hypothetical protein VICG_00207 [Vittaforma corneae ATCC 50505]
MFDFASHFKALDRMTQPSDLVKSPVILDEETPLRYISLENNGVVETNEMLYRNTRNTKKHIKSAWDVDIKAAGPGYFDEAGNYILSKPKKIHTTWILKRNGSLEGPFSDKEFKLLLNTVSYANYWVKRDFDKGFVPLDKLVEEVPSFNFKELNKFFAKNQVVEEYKKDDEFFETSVVNEKSTRLTNFLKNHEISASVDFVIKNIKNMRKADAIETLKDITGLDRCVNAALIDLIIESTDYQILCDVDKDGFYIGDEKKASRRK